MYFSNLIKFNNYLKFLFNKEFLVAASNKNIFLNHKRILSAFKMFDHVKLKIIFK